MKSIDVVAAIIEHDGRIFATQRGYGDLKGGWEFPGGKVEPGETPEESTVREIREELDCTIDGRERLHDRLRLPPPFHLHMGCYYLPTPADTHPCSSIRPPSGSAQPTSTRSTGCPPTSRSSTS